MVMQPAAVAFDDVVAATTIYLRSKMDPTVFVGADLTRWRRPQDAVHVTRVGTPAVTPMARGIFEGVRLQVDVYSEDWDRIFDITSELRLAMAVLPTTVTQVKRVAEQLVLQHIPEDEGPRAATDFILTVAGTQTP